MLCHDGDLSDLKRKDMVAEMKFDGTRVLIIKEQGKIRLQNRDGIDYTVRLGEIVQAAKRITASQFILDGEAVFVNSKGEIEFVGSQRRCATQFPDILLRMQYPIVHKCFDIIELNGEDWIDRPYEERKTVLKDLLRSVTEQTIQYVPYRTDLERAFEEVVKKREEGLILKRLGSKYEHARSYNWLKVKNWVCEVCEVAGYTPGKNARSIYFGSLVLVKDGKFRGCVGSGFTDRDLRQFKKAFDAAEKMGRPFEIGESWTAIKTNLKVKVKYYRITKSGVFRFPVYQGIVS